MITKIKRPLAISEARQISASGILTLTSLPGRVIIRGSRFEWQAPPLPLQVRGSDVGVAWRSKCKIN